MTRTVDRAAHGVSQEAVLTKAVLNAADRLDVTSRVLASILGISESAVSRLRTKATLLKADSKEFELGVLFVRLFRSLDAIAGGEEKVARAWVIEENTALRARPIDKMTRIVGLMEVIAYLDARRAIV